MSTVCVCGHESYAHYGKGDKQWCNTPECRCAAYCARRECLPINPTDVDLVSKHYPKARKSSHTGKILSGENDANGVACMVVGDTWAEAAENIRNAKPDDPVEVTHIVRMEELIKSIAKYTLDANKLQVAIMHDFHELHTRLEMVKRGK